MNKVLFISQWYPHRYDPMFGLFVRKHAEALLEFNSVAVLYVFADEKIRQTQIEISDTTDLLEIFVYYPTKTNSSVFSKVLNLLSAYKCGILTLHKKWGKPDIIQANIFTRTALIASILGFYYQCPYTVIEHWTRYFRKNTFNNYLHRIITRIVAKRAASVMPVTHHLQLCMEKHGISNNNYQIINNVVDNLFFQDIAKPESTKIRIINVTCFDDAQKNLTGILNVVDQLGKKRDDFEIFLVGTGTDFEFIKSYSDKLNLTNRFVHFTGMLIGTELVKQYQSSHFSILFSNYENIPVVISESFACGIPVISTNVGGINEHITADNGILINRGDENALMQAIEYMLDNHLNYDKQAIRNFAKEKYSYHAVGSQIHSIYNKILKNDTSTNM